MKQRRALFFKGLLLCALILGLSFYALFSGSYGVGLKDALLSISGESKGAAQVVIVNIRLPRIVSALVSGFSLAISGLAIQTLLKNPLGSAFTLGISQAAAFGAAFGIICLGAGGFDQGALFTQTALVKVKGLFTVTFCAFCGALAATAVILGLSLYRKMRPDAMILVGVALSSLFTAGTILLQYFADEVRLASIVFWTFGDVSRANWPEIGFMSLAVAFCSSYYFFNREDLNAMLAGDDVAKSVGVNSERLRLTGMGLAAALAGCVTAYNGVIAFLGLLAPHIARRLVGENHALLIPFSGLAGAMLLLLADTLGRVCLSGASLPVGVLTSFMGAPLFLYLLLKDGRKWG